MSRAFQTHVPADVVPDLGALLLEGGAIDIVSLDRARRVAAETVEPLDRVLTRLGLVAEATIVDTFARGLGIQRADATALASADRGLAARLNHRFLLDHRIVPLTTAADRVVVAMADPTAERTLKALEFALKRGIEPRIAAASDIEAMLSTMTVPTTIAAVEASDASELLAQATDRIKEAASDAPAIKLVNQWITRAVDAGASDLHLEPSPQGLILKHRLDGALVTIETIAPELSSSVLSRLKVIAQLDIAERRLPQDGKIRIPVRGRDVDIRVSIVPAIHGEAAVLRVLDRSGLRLDLESLGYDGNKRARLEPLLAEPHGIVLVTGPTGSGKTTTLYAGLLHIQTPDRKFLTVEDPVEYQIPGIVQTQVNPAIGLGFAATLRAFLRHDPDVILLGEIRDTETAEVAIQAALTGHLVLSTLHTNDAPSATTRLLDMGVEPYLITATVRGVVGQRLVRRLCPHCRRKSSEDAVPLGITAERRPRSTWQAVGCTICRGTGFVGRTTIAEVMPMSDALRRAVMDRLEPSEIRRIAIHEGMVSMLDDGLELASRGVTTTSDVLRAVREA
jgi:general secretion pathway protein E